MGSRQELGRRLRGGLDPKEPSREFPLKQSDYRIHLPDRIILESGLYEFHGRRGLPSHVLGTRAPGTPRLTEPICPILRRLWHSSIAPRNI